MIHYIYFNLDPTGTTLTPWQLLYSTHSDVSCEVDISPSPPIDPCSARVTSPILPISLANEAGENPL